MACSLYALLAHSARRAVVFRRGPSKEVLLLTWDLQTDRLTEGQWLKGRIYERRSDLSPSGELLVYFAANWHPPYQTWTAVSRPPWLTALALWPKGDTWGGGGHFENDRTLVLHHNPPLTLAEGFRVPKSLRVLPVGEGSGVSRMERDGWTLLQEGGALPYDSEAPITFALDPPHILRKASPVEVPLELREITLGYKERDGRWDVVEHELRRGEEVASLGRSDWADWDITGDLLFSQGGKLFRLRSADAAKLVLARAVMIADLEPLTFTQRPPPKSLRW